MQNNALPWVWISLLIIILDQITKLWISNLLVLHQVLPVIPFFNLILVHNEGAGFSLLADAGGWQRWLFIGIALVISIFLIISLSRIPFSKKRLSIALTLILGGAIGNNLIDRLLYGYVIDFIQIYYKAWSWPAFNIADTAITIGAILLAIDTVFEKHDNH